MTAPEVVHVHRAEVTRVIDGDTFVARVELDFRVKVDITVRVRDLWEPEMDTPEGVAAKAALEARLAAVNNQVVLRSYKDRQSFARWICDVWLGGAPLTNIGAPPQNDPYPAST